MARKSLYFLIFILFFSVFLFTYHGANAYIDLESPNAQTDTYVKNQYIVKFKPGLDPKSLKSKITKEINSQKDFISKIRFMIKNFKNPSTFEKQLRSLLNAQKSAGVIKIEDMRLNGPGKTYLMTTDGTKTFDQIKSLYDKLPQIDYIEPNYIYTIQQPTL